MDKSFAVEKGLATLQPKTAIARLLNFDGNLQGKKGFAARDIRNLVLPGVADDTGLKVLLSKAVNQSLLELNGTNYTVKGHRKSAKSQGKIRYMAKKAAKKAAKEKKKSEGLNKGKNGEVCK